MQRETDTREEVVSLFEVIASYTSRPEAFGVTFSDEGQATAYRERLEALGYTVEPSPEFATEPTLEAALESAAAYFRDPRLTQEK